MRQKLFIMKAWEMKSVKDDMRINAAVINAIGNTNKKKNQRFRPLWKKKALRAVANKDEMIDGLQAVKQMEETRGKSWVEKIYKANMMGGA